jgi:hypothetical protein
MLSPDELSMAVPAEHFSKICPQASGFPPKTPSHCPEMPPPGFFLKINEFFCTFFLASPFLSDYPFRGKST